jgi:hypothetical protein
LFVRIAWVTLGVAAFLCCITGAVVTPASLLIFWVVLGFGIGLAVGKSIPSARKLSGAWVGAGVTAAFVAMCLTVTGMIAFVGSVGTMSLLALSVAGVWASRRSWRDSNSPPEHGVNTCDSPAPAVPPTPAHALPTDELCVAWRRSYLQLQRATDEQTRQQLIRVRQAYLDELERRDRSGFARWLHDGARAGSDPRRYLSAD